MGVEWSYEFAMYCKGYECSVEAGLQTLLQVYIQMRTGWVGLQFWRELVKAYMVDGGTELLIFYDKTFALQLYHDFVNQ